MLVKLFGPDLLTVADAKEPGGYSHAAVGDLHATIQHRIDPKLLARLNRKFPGIRQVRQFDLFYGLLRAISAQQINLRWAATLRRRLAAARTSLREVVREARLQHGLALLQTSDLPIKAVAFASGYRSATSFSRNLAARYGVDAAAVSSWRDRLSA